MARRTTTAVITAALAPLTVLALTAGAAAATGAPAPRAASSEPVSAGTPVRFCPAAFQHLDFSGTSAKPVKKVHAPSTVSRPTGLGIPKPMALYGVMNDRRRAAAGKSPLAYQTLAGPTGFACSGIGLSQDDVSWATFRSPGVASHSMTATFDQGQEVFPAMCAYLAGAHRLADARSWARTTGETLRQCRRWTDDAPLSATLHPVAVTGNRRGPIAVVIHAPAGSQFTGAAFTPRGRSLPGLKTTTDTVSVAILAYTSIQAFTVPQTFDCSLPAARRSICTSAAAVFADQALQGSYHWSARGAARAARKIAGAIG